VAASPAATDNSHSAIFDSPRPPCSNARFPTTSQPASITHTRCVCEPQSTPTNQCCFNGHLLALPWIHGPQLHGLRILQRPLGQVTRPIVHQDTPAFEQVRAGIVRLDPVPDHMRRAAPITPPGMVCLLIRPVPEGRAEAAGYRRNSKLPQRSASSPSLLWRFLTRTRRATLAEGV